MRHRIRGALSTLDQELSVAFPMIWRTRTLFAVAGGIGASTVAWMTGRYVPVTGASVVGLTTALTAMSVVTWTIIAGAGALALDQAWRSGTVLSRSQIARLLLCIGVSVGAVLLPPLVFVRATMPRVARLDDAATLAFHRANKYWVCESFEPPDRWVARPDDPELFQRVERDFARYGLRLPAANMAFVTGCTNTALTDREDLPQTATEDDFEAALRRMHHVEAAQAFLRGQGPYPSIWLTRIRHLAAWTGMFVLAAGLTMSFRTGRLRLLDLARRLRAPVPGREWWQKLDEYFAAYMPNLWATQLHASLVDIAIVAIGARLMLPNYETSNQWWAMGALLGLPLLLARRQRHMRGATVRRSWECLTFFVHVLVFWGLAWGLGSRNLIPSGGANVTPVHFYEAANVVVWFAVTVAAWLQAVRTIPIIQALLGYFVGFATLLLMVLGLETFRPASPAEMQWILILGVVGFNVVVSTGAWLLSRLVLKPIAAGVLYSAALATAPSVAFALAAAWANFEMSSSAFVVALVGMLLLSVLQILATFRTRIRIAAIAR